MTYQQSIAEIVEVLKAKYRPEKIILFGSYAYGEPSADSDIDLLIIKNTTKRPIDRWMEAKKILRDISKTLAVSPLIYTESEIKKRIELKDFFIKEVLEKGKVLYG